MEEKQSKKISRRALLGGVMAAAVVPVGGAFAKYIPAGAPVDDPTKKIGPGPGKLGKRSPFEQPVKKPSDISSRTPLQDLYSTITPSDLHF
jgi:sulfane dehydrogenase subunit SoxC